MIYIYHSRRPGEIAARRIKLPFLALCHCYPYWELSGAVQLLLTAQVAVPIKAETSKADFNYAWLMHFFGSFAVCANASS